ncbi:hypothetical protein EGX90_02570 [Gardnerella vaginalis]|nr:hypothetical protein EGX90_02570 [Gardnerella vaginalis]PNL25584.1 hypothetical protein CEP75_002555 [Gardnerella vaginalis]PTE03284.1 hypothetical protein C6Y65_06825 [Gardnerella vaginalis]
MKAQCAFNASEDVRALRPRERFPLLGVVGGLANSCLTTLRLLRVVCCCGCSDLALILFLG